MEHRSTRELRDEVSVSAAGDQWRLVATRYVCTCGHTTNWFVDRRSADAARDAHALDGQLSFE